VDIENLLRQALDLGEEGNWEGMARELSQALELDPENPSILCWIGVAEQELGAPGAAYDRFKEALAQDPEDPFILATVGNGLAQFDDPDAEGALRTAALLAPDLPLARMLFGAYLSREGLFEDALRELKAAAELDPDDPTIAYELGVSLALEERKDEALLPLLRAVDLDPGEGWGQVVLGLVEADLGQLEEASRDLSGGARLRPFDFEAQILAALAASAAGWEDLAYEMLERGRLVAVEGDQLLLDLAETRITDGGEEAGDLLTQDLLPSALRERLMQRP
jgi:tetratricopeptide (TPR) repeat protein